MNRKVEDAMLTEAAQKAAMEGWSLDEIRNWVCVECGLVDVPQRGPGGVDAPAKMPGRKIGYRQNGTRYDAGHICGDCMSE